MADLPPLSEERWYMQLIDQNDPDARSYEIYAEGQGAIVARSYLGAPGKEHAEQNRRIKDRCSLMTAAPELLAALEAAREELSIAASYDEDRDMPCGIRIHARMCRKVLTQVDAAIAKAKSEEVSRG